MTIRAKFRCLRTTKNWKDRETAELRPVLADSGGPRSEENRAFWTATPAGELELTYEGNASSMPELGKYYYVDLDEAVDGERSWHLFFDAHTKYQLVIVLQLDWKDGAAPSIAQLRMSIDNKDAWPHFLGKVGSKWSVKITPAE